MAIVSIGDHIGILGIEAKVDETFGPTVSEWLSQSEGTDQKRRERLKSLCGLLRLELGHVSDLRYQLIHRTASAIIEAKRYHSTEAMVIVESFCPKKSWFNDFKSFVAALGLGDASVGTATSSKEFDGVTLRLGWVAEETEKNLKRLDTPRTVPALTELGRVKLSKSFFMRDMLYSEVAMIHGLNNAPDDPKLAIQAGEKLCEELLEPLQDHWGRIAIRSAYRSCEVNGFCNQMQKQKKAGYTCAANEANYAGHIWDRLDAKGYMGATACVVIPSFWEKNQNQGDWQIMAKWIHENLPYSSLYFFPKYWAFNIGWHQKPERLIKSYAEPMGTFIP